eukprot:872758-Pleurochrysis_carterae.AAC.1
MASREYKCAHIWDIPYLTTVRTHSAGRARIAQRSRISAVPNGYPLQRRMVTQSMGYLASAMILSGCLLLDSGTPACGLARRLFPSQLARRLGKAPGPDAGGTVSCPPGQPRNLS